MTLHPKTRNSRFRPFRGLSGAPKLQDKSVWSCLLFCAVETKGFHRCSFFFERLKACGSPSPKDFGPWALKGTHARSVEATWCATRPAAATGASR